MPPKGRESAFEHIKRVRRNVLLKNQFLEFFMVSESLSIMVFMTFILA